MKTADNLNLPEGEPSPPFVRHDNGLYVPDDHDPDCLIVYQHGFNPARHGHHFASIIAGKPGEHLFEEDRASIVVWSDDDSSLNFTNGLFGRYSLKGSILIPTSPFPALVNLLQMEPWPLDEDDDDFATYGVESAYQHQGRRVFFHNLALELPCEGLQLIKHWDHYEAEGLDWMDRFRDLFHHMCGEETVVELQERCKSLGLKLGQENPHKEQLECIDACLDILEAWHWEQVRLSSTKLS